jgi:hypothetical protein
MEFDKSKRELVYPTPSYKDPEISKLVNICKEKDWRLVLICPLCKEYPPEIDLAFAILGNNLLIYEIAMGMRVVLNSRARKYTEYHKNSSLYEKN